MPPDDTKPQVPAIPLERTKGTQAALDALGQRTEKFEALHAETARAFSALGQRVRPARKVAQELEAAGRGESRAVRAALDQGRAEYDRQAQALWASSDAMARRRRKLVAIAEAFRLAIRGVLAEMASEPPLVEAARGTIAHGRERMTRLQGWLDAKLQRWQPSPAPGTSSPDLKSILRVLPDLDRPKSVAEAPPAAAADDDTGDLIL